MLTLPTPPRRRARAAVLLLPMTLALISLFLALPVCAAQVNPGPVTPVLDLGTLLKLVMGHQWLAAAIFVVAFARVLLSDRSKRLPSIPAPWLPTVSAVLGAAFTVLVAVQGGAPLGVTLVGAFVMFVGSGALDGLLVAMYGDPSKAPKWARWVVGIADDLTGGGGSSGSASSKKPDTVPPAKPTPPAVSRLALATLAATVLLLTGCPSNGQLPPNVPPIVDSGLVLTECAWTTYTTDTGKVPPDSWQQIALDLATQCGMDVVDFVHSFGESHPATLAAKANASAVHAAAMASKAGK